MVVMRIHDQSTLLMILVMCSRTWPYGPFTEKDWRRGDQDCPRFLSDPDKQGNSGNAGELGETFRWVLWLWLKIDIFWKYQACVSTQPMPDFSAVLPRLEPYGKIGVSKMIPQVKKKKKKKRWSLRQFQTTKSMVVTIMIADDDVDERCDNWKRLSWGEKTETLVFTFRPDKKPLWVKKLRIQGRHRPPPRILLLCLPPDPPAVFSQASTSRARQHLRFSLHLPATHRGLPLRPGIIKYTPQVEKVPLANL